MEINHDNKLYLYKLLKDQQYVFPDNEPDFKRTATSKTNLQRKELEQSALSWVGKNGHAWAQYPKRRTPAPQDRLISNIRYAHT